jgi:hypothetical protein
LGDEGQPDRKKNNVLARKRLLPTKSFNQHHTYFRVGLIGRGLGIMSPYLPRCPTGGDASTDREPEPESEQPESERKEQAKPENSEANGEAWMD